MQVIWRLSLFTLAMTKYPTMGTLRRKEFSLTHKGPRVWCLGSGDVQRQIVEEGRWL